MWLTSLLEKLNPDSQHGRPARVQNRTVRKRPAPCRLTLEALEDRSLLSYAIADLGAFAPAHLNEAGVVIGNRSAAGYTHAVLWSRSGGLQELGTLGGVSSGVNAINEAGVVLGSAATADGVTGNGFLIQPRDTNQDGIPDLWFEDVNKDGINDLMRDFKTLGIPFYAASAMNESGQLLSGMQLWDSVNGLQSVYNGASGFLSNALNNAGQVGGYRYLPHGSTHAYLYSGGQAIALGELPTDLVSMAYDLNDAAQVVGASGRVVIGSFQPREAFLWAEGKLTGLGFLPGATVSESRGINSFGQVVGTSNAGGGRAFIWDKGAMTDLNSQIDPSSGWVLGSAVDINDQGQIIGMGVLSGQGHAFLLTPAAPPAGIRVQPTPGLNTTEAGGTVHFSVKLNTQPTADVTIALSSSDLTEGAVSPASLTFTPGNWNIFQTVTVTGVDDPIYDGNIKYKILTAPAVSADPAYNGIDAADLSLTNLDNDPPVILTINSVSVTEGDTGTVAAVFTVTRTGPTNQPSTADYSTVNIFGGTATVGIDFVAVSGTLTFAPGETSQTISVLVNGDTLNEANETFRVVLSNPFNASISGGGIGTILNDDPVPALTINDVARIEGNSGITYFVFTVSLSAASGQTVTVNYATADGTATSSGSYADYQATSGTLTFAPGETTKTITVAVFSDTRKEANETFFINLSGALNASILHGQGLGTILNDD